MVKSQFRAFHVDDDNFWYDIESEFGQTGGVYNLICIQDKQRIPIARLLSIDNNGILYIGKATSFLNRVIELKKSLSKEYETLSHEAGYRYLENDKIQNRFPYEDLYVLLKPADDINKAEKDMLNAYIQKFGELPPLNRVG